MKLRTLGGGLLVVAACLAAGCKHGDGSGGRGFRKSTASEARRSPLHTAARLGDVATVQRLVKEGTPVDLVVGQGRTALQEAAAASQFATARALLDLGANPSLQDGIGENALMKAAARGETEVVAAMLTKRPDVNLKTTKRGYTALHYASDRGHADVVTLLVKAGADTTATDSQGRTPEMVSKGNAAVMAALSGKPMGPSMPMAPMSPMSPPPAPMSPPPPAPIAPPMN